jgi:hypothetical protein
MWYSADLGARRGKPRVRRRVEDCVMNGYLRNFSVVALSLLLTSGPLILVVPGILHFEVKLCAVRDEPEHIAANRSFDCEPIRLSNRESKSDVRVDAGGQHRLDEGYARLPEAVIESACQSLLGVRSERKILRRSHRYSSLSRDSLTLG